MTQITLTERLIRKLLAESSGNQTVFRQLCREAIVRQWLKYNGIPSWRNPKTPEKNSMEITAGRYSILLADGSRFIVCSYPCPVLSLDGLAAAKSFAALAVKLEKNGVSGSIPGCIFLRNISQSIQRYNFINGGLESSSIFLHYLTVPGSYVSRLVSFSIRLLLSGEPDAPERGTEGVKAFCPSARG